MECPMQSSEANESPSRNSSPSRRKACSYPVTWKNSSDLNWRSETLRTLPKIWKKKTSSHRINIVPRYSDGFSNSPCFLFLNGGCFQSEDFTCLKNIVLTIISNMVTVPWGKMMMKNDGDDLPC